MQRTLVCILSLNLISSIIISFTYVEDAIAADTLQDRRKQQKLDEAITNLSAVNKEWQRNDTEFRAMREKGHLSDNEVAEFAQFVAGLKRKVLEGCQSVRKLGGTNDQHDVDCVKLGDKPEELPEDKLLPEITREQTQAEKAAQLKKELEALEKDFDEMIVVHQQNIKQREQQRTANTDWDNNNQFQDSEPGGDSSGGSSAALSEESSDTKSSQEKWEPGAGPGVEKQGKMPDFKSAASASGSDDDIVAKQLREAAEVETDPVLKEQLWAEYKNYKNSMK